MSERRVLKMGNPILKAVSKPVADFSDPQLAELITDLWDTMHARGGIGIAAPQVGVLQQVVVFGREVDPVTGAEPLVPKTVLINPVITVIGDEVKDGWEGCLSIPGMRGMVPRHQHIRYTGVDYNGEAVDRQVSGYHAVVVQHECDHLDGVLYHQRITDMSTFGFEEEISLSGSYQPNECDD